MTFDADKLRALDEAATPGPWETDNEYDGDGYASSGGGCTSGWNNYFVGAEIDGKWRTLLDTVNSDHKLIEDDRDGDGGMAWDVIGMANAELVAHLRNLVPAILAMAEENKRLREALRSIANLQRHSREDDAENAQMMENIATRALRSGEREG